MLVNIRSSVGIWLSENDAFCRAYLLVVKDSNLFTTACVPYYSYMNPLTLLLFPFENARHNPSFIFILCDSSSLSLNFSDLSLKDTP